MSRDLVLIKANPQIYGEVRKTAKECGLDEFSTGVFVTHMYHLHPEQQFQHTMNSIQKFRAQSPDTLVYLVRAADVHVMSALNF